MSTAMNNKKQERYYKEGVALLYEGSYKAIPFNIVLSVLLACDLLYNKVPVLIVGSWIASIFIISLIRMFYCLKNMKQNESPQNQKLNLYFFILLTFLTGVAWGACYLVTLPYLNELHEFIIILVFGGMCAGSIASLSISLPAYYAYILPMFVPVIVYNFAALNFDRAILALMFFLFVVMVLISAKMNNKLLNTIFKLSNDKESLIIRLKVMSITDPLTELYNRRYFDDVLNNEFHRAKRNNYAINLVFIDIDNFKIVNDNFGHPNGDILLIDLADLLKKSLRRSNDIIFRLGGDEFAIILINSSTDKAFEVCQDIQYNFQKRLLSYDQTVFHNPQLLQQITLSIGIVNAPLNSELNPEHIVTVTDEALYKAKSDGKNKIIIRDVL